MTSMLASAVMLDSCCWIAWLAHDDGRGELLDDVVERYDGRVVVPSIVLFEIDRWLGRNPEVSDLEHHDVLARIQRETAQVIDHAVAQAAGRCSRAHGLATADALIVGAAHVARCDLVTFDSDFAGAPNVIVLPTPGQSE